MPEIVFCYLSSFDFGPRQLDDDVAITFCEYTLPCDAVYSQIAILFWAALAGNAKQSVASACPLPIYLSNQIVLERELYAHRL